MGVFPASAYCRSSCLTSWSLNNASVRHPTSTPWATLSIRSGPTWRRPARTSRACGSAPSASPSRAGNAVSAEYLAWTLHQRAKSLVDDPSTALFFGRTDHTNGERWYIGRRHVADPSGDPVVVDWRADVSRAFYRASRAEPMGVERRRRFGIEAGSITAYEDEHLTDPAETTGRSAILAREIERPRVGPMRDIVATIQPEQDEIVRAGAGTTVCVQGAPGTGKTAVGLHRAAWLLYAHRDKLARAGVLVVGPNSRVPRARGRRPAEPRGGRGAAHDGGGPRGRRGGTQRRGRGVPSGPGGGDPCPGVGPRACRRPRRGRPDGSGTAPGRMGARGRAPGGPRAAPGVAAVAAAGVPGAKRSSRSCADAAPATARRARCSPTGSRTRSSCSWRRRATPPTTACRTPSPAAATYAATSTSSGRRWSRGRFCTGSSRTCRSWSRAPRAC